MSEDWKRFRRRPIGGCACGPDAELHVMFVPRTIVGIAGMLATAALVVGKAGSIVYAFAVLATAGSVISLATVAYAHCWCSRCGRIARPEAGRERETLALIRLGAVLVFVVLAGAVYGIATR